MTEERKPGNALRVNRADPGRRLTVGACHHTGGRCAWGGEEAGHRRGLTIHGRGTRGTITRAGAAPGEGRRLGTGAG